jgi:hypothetical protein
MVKRQLHSMPDPVDSIASLMLRSTSCARRRRRIGSRVPQWRQIRGRVRPQDDRRISARNKPLRNRRHQHKPALPALFVLAHDSGHHCRSCRIRQRSPALTQSKAATSLKHRRRRTCMSPAATTPDRGQTAESTVTARGAELLRDRPGITVATSTRAKRRQDSQWSASPIHHRGSHQPDRHE